MDRNETVVECVKYICIAAVWISLFYFVSVS